MKKTVVACMCTLTLGAASLVQAQSAGQRDRAADDRAGATSIPGMSQGYLGFGVGRSRFDDSPCVAGFACDNRDTGYKFFAGSRINQHFGIELSYLNFGEVNRNGGDAEAHGLNLGLVGTVPLGSQFNLVGKLGTMYSRTRTSAATPLVTTGKDNGFGLSYGLGARLDLTRTWALRADWDRYRAQFVGRDDDISLYSVGLMYKF